MHFRVTPLLHLILNLPPDIMIGLVFAHERDRQVLLHELRKRALPIYSLKHFVRPITVPRLLLDADFQHAIHFKTLFFPIDQYLAHMTRALHKYRVAAARAPIIVLATGLSSVDGFFPYWDAKFEASLDVMVLIDGIHFYTSDMSPIHWDHFFAQLHMPPLVFPN